ncbi:MAG: hypothetical protein ABS42_00205 [Bdellovibrio sp. SCN 50-8]|nr:MAG: hypothetical protein ABS42_00205 [Bdellovibrio sp. SCN 50-8]
MKVTTKPSLHASWIDRDASDIVRRLQAKGHKTYLVGGCVRDLLCGVVPKDYDIATEARPNEVRKLIFGSYVIGRRFRLVLVKRGDQQFEVATFRRASREEDFAEGEDTPVGDNFFGTPEEDALRRDFTINGLFYDPSNEQLIDYCEGMVDIDSRTLRVIGKPGDRIVEDPIRSLRALRLSHKLGFKIEPELREAVQSNAALLEKSVLPRRREEYLKILRLPSPGMAFIEMWDLGLLQACLPSIAAIFEDVHRQETFLNYLERIPEFCKDTSNPIELYALLVMALRASLEGTGFEGEKEETFYRLELGMFRSEWGEVEQALHLRHRLSDLEHFRRRGHRRQQAFLNHPGLHLAVRVGAFENELMPDQVFFWEQRLAGVPLPPRDPSKDLNRSTKSPTSVQESDQEIEDEIQTEAMTSDTLTEQRPD